MANEEHLVQLIQGTQNWNRWRQENWCIKPDLSGADLSGTDLEGAFLSETDLRGVNFSGANLSRANINQATLDGATLDGANLHKTGLSGINLLSTTFGDADLEEAVLSCSKLIGVDLSRAKLRRVNLQGAELNHANLSGVDLSHSDLSLAKLNDADLSKATLLSVDLHKADLRKANLRGATLQHADLSGAFLHETQIDQTTHLEEKWFFVWSVVNQVAKVKDLRGTALRGINLSGTDLSQVDFSGANLRDANLSEVNLRGAKLDKTNLHSADLSGATLLEASLREANLIHANLSNADLAGWNVSGNLMRIDLKGADLFRACLFNAHLFRAKLFRVNLEEADLRQADLSEANLVRANLSRACLERANLIRAQAVETDFTEARLTGACIEDWNINNTTKLDGIICDYIYKKRCREERRPRSGNFASGEFTALTQKAIETVDICFIDGIDWKAFFQSFQELRARYGEENISIQALEKKNGEAFLIRLEVSPQINKTEIERQANELYEIKLKMKSQAELYQVKLQAKEEQVAIYREQLEFQRQSNTNLTGVVKTMAEKEHTNQTTIQANNIGFVQSGSGTVTNFSQNIGQNIDEITKLINSLRATAQNFPDDQRDEALVHLDDLQEDINTPEKQKPQRIKTRIVALLAIASTVAGVVAGAADFSNNVLELSEKLDIPIKIRQSQPMQQLPTLKPNQPHDPKSPN